MSKLGVEPKITLIRRFVLAERRMRDKVFRPGGMDATKKRSAKLQECDDALAALAEIEQVFIPRVTQEDMFDGS